MKNIQKYKNSISIGVILTSIIFGFLMITFGNYHNAQAQFNVAAQLEEFVRDGDLSNLNDADGTYNEDSLLGFRNSIWYYGDEDNLWEIHFPGNILAGETPEDRFNIYDYNDVYCVSRGCRWFVENGGQPQAAYNNALVYGEGMWAYSNCGNWHVFIARQDKCANVPEFQWLTDDRGYYYVAVDSTGNVIGNDVVDVTTNFDHFEFYRTTNAETRQCEYVNPDMCSNLDGDQDEVPPPYVQDADSDECHVPLEVSCEAVNLLDDDSISEGPVPGQPFLWKAYPGSGASVPLTYVWSGSASNPATGSQRYAEGQYNSPGTYTANVQVTQNIPGGQTKSAQCSVDVVDDLLVSCDLRRGTVLAVGQSFDFVANVYNASGAVSYVWGGVAVGNTNTADFTPQNPGTFQAQIEVTDAEGNTDSDICIVNIGTGPDTGLDTPPLDTPDGDTPDGDTPDGAGNSTPRQTTPDGVLLDSPPQTTPQTPQTPQAPTTPGFNDGETTEF